MNNSIIPKTVAEYFAGIGLVRMGLEQNNWQITFANDISPKKFEMYNDFFPKAQEHYIIKDIFNLETKDIPVTTLATCSFPCIDLSLAGNRNGIKGKHSSAFWGFIKALKTQGESSPNLILVENVPGWLSSNNGNDFRVTVQALNELGYICDVFVLNALHFTPQSRLRVFLVGLKSDESHTNIDLFSNRHPALITDKLYKNIFTNNDLNWFYNDIPVPPKLKEHRLDEIIEQIEITDKRWWHDELVQKHFNMMSDSHRKMVEFYIQSNQIHYKTFFRRVRYKQQRVEVRSDNFAGCLRTAIGGSGKQFLIKAGQGKLNMRTMTSREYARLQGVPDKYPIKVNELQALTGFGDAVCVPAITWIARNVLEPLLEKIKTPTKELEAINY